MVAPNTAPMIVIKGLHKNFDEHAVLRGVDLCVEQGECLVVLGRSGEGKSVLLKHIVGLFRPDGGSVTVQGQVVHQLNRNQLFELRQHIGYLFQGSALFDSLTVLENVGFALTEHHGMARRAMIPLVKEYLKQVQLGDVLDKYPADLSGGMKRRVALARALAMEPSILLYDEPTTGVDPVTSDAINRLIRQVQQDRNVTSVLVTHELASAYTVGDRIALLHQGKIVACDTTENIRKTTNPLVRQFLDGQAEGPLTDNKE